MLQRAHRCKFVQERRAFCRFNSSDQTEVYEEDTSHSPSNEEKRLHEKRKHLTPIVDFVP